MNAPESLSLQPIGTVVSALKDRKGAPKQGDEGAPDATLKIDPQFTQALEGIEPGNEVWILTWLHQSNRETLKVRPRGNPDNELCGVFATRSPDRPNPIGLHRARVLEKDGLSLRVQGLEAIDGTPIVDIKPVINADRACR